MSRVLVIADIHAPATHPDYFDFIRDIRKKYRTNKTVFIGDIIDHHVISFHRSHPEYPGAIEEYTESYEQIKRWYKSFSDAYVTIGNHDERVHRLAADSGIPSMYLKEYNEIYCTPKWNWVPSVEIDGVYYYHGRGSGTQYPAFAAAKTRNQSAVMGHYHSKAAINWLSGRNKNLIFGMSVGSGVDSDHLAMKYGEHSLTESIVSCGVVLEGHPYLEIMSP